MQFLRENSACGNQGRHRRRERMRRLPNYNILGAQIRPWRGPQGAAVAHQKDQSAPAVWWG